MYIQLQPTFVLTCSFTFPLVSVGNVSGYVTSPLSIYLSWEGPVEASLIILVESYLVSVEEIETGQDWNETSQQTFIALTSLHPHYSYELAVAATTNNTIQPYSTPVILTTFQAGLSMHQYISIITLLPSFVIIYFVQLLQWHQ